MADGLQTRQARIRVHVEGMQEIIETAMGLGACLATAQEDGVILVGKIRLAQALKAERDRHVPTYLTYEVLDALLRARLAQFPPELVEGMHLTP